MTAVSRTVAVEVGSRLTYEGDHWQIASLGSDDVLLTRGVKAVRVSVQALVNAGALEAWVDEGAALDGFTPMDALPAAEREKAHALTESITLMRTGFRLGVPIGTDEEPDPRFAPGIGQRQREKALAAELGTTDRQVRRLCAAYDQYGVVGLVDARHAQIRRPMGECDPQVRDAILAVLDRQTHGSKINAVNTRLQVQELLNEWHQQAVQQAEADGIGPADRAQFETMVGRVTAPLPEGRTSRSPGRGSLRGR